MEKAKSDSEAVGINCSLGSFSDRIMEGCHKLGRQGKFSSLEGRQDRQDQQLRENTRNVFWSSSL